MQRDRKLPAQPLEHPFPVKNTNKDLDIEFHNRYYGLVDDFKGTVRMPDPVLNPKVKEYVWVKDSLLHMIFDRQKPEKPHAQKEAYNRLREKKKIIPHTFTFRGLFKGNLFNN